MVPANRKEGWFRPYGPLRRAIGLGAGVLTWLALWWLHPIDSRALDQLPLAWSLILGWAPFFLLVGLWLLLIRTHRRKAARPR